MLRKSKDDSTIETEIAVCLGLVITDVYHISMFSAYVMSKMLTTTIRDFFWFFLIQTSVYFNMSSLCVNSNNHLRVFLFNDVCT